MTRIKSLVKGSGRGHPPRHVHPVPASFPGSCPHNTSLIILTEYIGTGGTIVSIIEGLYEIPDDNAGAARLAGEV